MEELIGWVHETTLVFSLGMTRIVSAMTTLSFLGTQALGGTLGRNGVALGLALIVFPVVEHEVREIELTLVLTLGILAKEVLVGMMIGYLVTVIFWAIQGVGFFIDNQRGASMASAMDPLVGAQSSPLGLFMTQTLVALFFATGLFLLFLEVMYKSYVTWPVTSFFPSLNDALLELIVAQFILITKLAVVVGGPIVIAMFLSEFGLGLIGRFAPQMNVFFLSMPIKSAVATFMLILFWGALVLYFGDLLDDIGRRTEEFDRAMRPEATP